MIPQTTPLYARYRESADGIFEYFLVVGWVGDDDGEEWEPVVVELGREGDGFSWRPNLMDRSRYWKYSTEDPRQ